MKKIKTWEAKIDVYRAHLKNMKCTCIDEWIDLSVSSNQTKEMYHPKGYMGRMWCTHQLDGSNLFNCHIKILEVSKKSIWVYDRCVGIYRLNENDQYVKELRKNIDLIKLEKAIENKLRG